ncbi:glycoside hydrolase family 99-like domain-containing protein [Viscerimonas tarda]
MKINKYLVYSLLLMGGLFVSCTDDENGLEGYPLNYKIPEVAVTEDIPVGAYLYDPSGVTNNEVNWTRLTEPFNDAPASEGGGKMGPYLMPTQGRYRFYTADSTTSLVYGNMVRWAKQAGIDFFITPAIRENVNGLYPNNLNTQDTLLLSLISGRVDTLAYANRGEMKYAIKFDINNWASQGVITGGTAALSNNNLLENVLNYQFTARYTPSGWPTYINGAGNEVPLPPYPKDSTFIISREERLYNIFKKLSGYFKDPTYYHTADGRPVLFLSQPQKLYTQKQKEIYDNIRDTVKLYSGKDVYIVAIQDHWTPSARFTHFFLKGYVDAVTEDNMCFVGEGQLDMTYFLNILINEHFKANRKYINENFPGIEYIPSVSSGWNRYVTNGNVNGPIIRHNPEQFRERCNIAKMNQSKTKMALIDSFNDWQNDSQIEPADPDYGNGYGTFYLDIVRQEFKRK